jgi:hypothetical protein
MPIYEFATLQAKTSAAPAAASALSDYLESDKTEASPLGVPDFRNYLNRIALFAAMRMKRAMMLSVRPR